MILAAVPVLADNGPHQTGASATTDGCSGCHRAHTGQVANLLVETQTALCYTCHGTSGTGATTDVQDGVQYAPVVLTQVSGIVRTGSGTTFAGALRGGGFSNAAIDTAPATTGTGIGTITPFAPTTSLHNVGAAGTLWGYGAIGSGAGTSNFAITCGSCHDPHGNGSYRILQHSPEGMGGPVAIADVANNTYRYTTLDYWQPLDPNAPSFGNNVTAWCSSCHTRYNAPADSATTDSGDPIFKYRHATTNGSGLQCVKCHVAHGSNATMGPNSQAVPWPGETAGRGTDSSLLRINNRGVCVQCHAK
jgi:predicted CXXCH cytochrome family protein